MELNFEEIAFEYLLTRESLTNLAKKYGVSRQTLSRHFKKMGIEVKNLQNESKFDDTIFDSIDTEEKAYWLGFIWADGNIAFVPEGAHRYEFELSLKGEDKIHLDKFNKFCKYKGDNVKLSKSKCSNKEFSRCRWMIANKHLWETLNNYGCTPRKSLTLKFPNESIFKSKDLIRHFIRGYFDGDGCITRYVNIKTVSPHVEIIGTEDILNKINYYSNIIGIKIHDKRHSDKTFINEYHKNEGINFINYLYSDCSIYLDRKYKLYKFFKNGSRSTEEFVELLQTNIGEGCDANPEISSELKKSEPSYSVEIETEKSE